MTSTTANATAPREKSHLTMVHAILHAGDSPVIDPSAINSATQAATTAGTIIQNYVSTVLNQADLSLPDVLPNLPEHQKNARTHATNWRDTVQGVQVQVVHVGAVGKGGMQEQVKVQ
jgi:hypothetical protein